MEQKCDRLITLLNVHEKVKKNIKIVPKLKFSTKKATV